MTATDIRTTTERIDRLRATFASGRTRPLEWRERQLDALARMLHERGDDLVAAIAADLGRPRFEGWLADIASSIRDVEHNRKHLRSWARAQKVRKPREFFAARAEIIREPLGVVLIIAPWNYPVNLLLMPLAAALAAGNTVVLKPSELTPTVSSALARIIPRYLDPEAVTVVEGGVEETTELLTLPFDHILYTGNGRVARVVATAAAAHLTPVTLELGGKSPVIVDHDANLKVTAKRIVWGKFLNAGQTCIAPDYVLAHTSIHDALVDAMVQVVRDHFGADPQASASLGRIVNERHTERLLGLIAGGGFERVACGGTGDVASHYVAPTILVGVDRDAEVMRDEIFGPILPVLRVESVDDAIGYVNAHDKPLALYVFGSDDTAEHVLASTSSGGACVNDVMTHFLIGDLPFGGVGPSGTGKYHGKAGFDLFSNQKSVVDRPTWFEAPMLYPPYTSRKEKIVRRVF